MATLRKICMLSLLLGAVPSASLKVPRNAEQENPLISRLDEPFPPYEAVEARHVVPAVKKHLKDAAQEFEAFEKAVSLPGFVPNNENLLTPYRLLAEPLGKAYQIANHIKSVRDSSELRAAINEMRPGVIEYSDSVSQSQPLYAAFKALKENTAEFGLLTSGQRRILELELQGFVMSGIGLEGAQQKEFNRISQRLSNLSSTFSENVLDSTKSWKKLVTDKTLLRGLPEAPLQLAAESAAREAVAVADLPGGKRAVNATMEFGPYLLTLDGPSAGAVLTYVEDASVRKEVYLASASTASELLGPDNTDVIREILELRQRKAQLLGFKSYAELSMQRKMATQESAEKLLEDLRETAYPKAKEDLADLLKFAKDHGAESELKHWDLGFWAHKQTKELFDIDAEELRPYFPLESVLSGLFGLAEKMVGVRVIPAEGPKWHKDVRLFEVRRNATATEAAAHLYMDLFARPSEKRAGAWQTGVQDYDFPRGRKPISAIVASLRPPVGDKPALLSFGEVHTLFHETGHALQHMLTRQQEPSLAGMGGVEWDAVELPSQFMEYWLDETDWVVKGFARHYKTGDTIPEEKMTKLKAALKFHPGMGMLGQLHMSIVDLSVHTTPLQPGETVTTREKRIAEERHTKLMEALPEARNLNSFSHIFAGGYAAGYYSYKWADVLSADAFARFQEEGATCAACSQQLQRIGKEYADTVLGEGGGRKAADVFASFRGRAPSSKALLHFTFGE